MDYQIQEPTEGLLSQVLARIEYEKKLSATKKKLVVFLLIFLTSLVAVIPTFQTLRTGFIDSGFIQFFGLLFSDFDIISNYWQNFTLSLLETLPVLNILIFLAVSFSLLESLKLMTREIKKISILNLKLK